MQMELKRPLFVPASSGEHAALWRVTQRMLAPYIDMTVRPETQAKDGDVIIEDAETADELLLCWSAALMRCAALDGQDEVAEFADVLTQSVQTALDLIEEDDSFLTAVAACLSQMYSADLVVLSTDEGDAQYEVVYRALRDEEEYAVLVPTDDEGDGLLILRCLYPDGDEEPAFTDADEDIAQSVYNEFLLEFADEFDDEE